MRQGRWFYNNWFRVALFSAFCFLLGFSYNYHLPKIEAFLLIELENLSQKHSPARIWAKGLHLQLFPIGVVLKDVRILPQEPLSRYMAPAEAKEIGAKLAIFPLLRGEVRLSQIFVRDSDLSFFLRPSLFQGSAAGKSHAKLDFEKLYRLPVDELSLAHVRLRGKVQTQVSDAATEPESPARSFVFKIDDLNLSIENRYRSLYVDLDVPSVQVKPSGKRKVLEAQVELRTLVEAREAQVSAFKLRSNDSFIVASGRVNGDVAGGRFDNGTADLRSKLQLTDLNDWEAVFVTKPAVPSIQGRAEANAKIEVLKDKNIRVSTSLSAESLKIDKFLIGRLQTEAESDLHSITVPRVAVENTAGKLALENVKIDLAAPSGPTLTGDVDLAEIELRQFLENLDVNDVPLRLPLNGHAKCDGAWGEQPTVICRGQFKSPRLWVYDESNGKSADPAAGGGKKRSTIIEAMDLNGEGDVTVNMKEVNYQADLAIGKSSTGKSHGVINYDSGFKIFYESENLELSDLKNLADLKLEGKMKVNGSTEGTARWATIDMNVDAADFWLDDYPFGRLNTKMKYKTGHLLFSGVQGQFGTSQYAGSLDLDLSTKQLKLHGEFPFADLHDLQQVFARKIELPFAASGTGQGQVDASGPLRLSQMTYRVRSSFFRGEVANENFDEFVFNINAKDGLVKSDQVTVTKSTGVVEGKGQITPKGEIDSVFIGRGLRLEQSENVRGYGLDVQGLTDFTVLIRGQLPAPRIELNGRLSRVILGDQPAEDSVFKLNFLNDRLEGSGQFLGTRILADLTYPYSKEGPFLLRLKARRWDFTSLFSAISKSARQMDVANSITGSINISSARGGFWNSTGQAKIDEFVLRKGAKSLSTTGPMYFNFRDGEINTDSVTVSSGDSYLKLDMAGLTHNRLNASLNGKMDISLLGIFTPFISDLRGMMTISADLMGSVAQPSLSGSAFIDRGYVKFADFTHPFSNIKAAVTFRDNSIRVNSLRCEIGGGKASAEGSIRFAENGRPIEARGQFSDVKLNVPTGFKTEGSGTISMTGAKFPYTMAIDYGVTGGEVVYEFGEDTKSGTASIKPSPYLPHFINQESFHPFTFNINADLKAPVKVNNQLAQLQATGRISAAGTPDKLLLNGTLTALPGGKVFFHYTPFDIASGYIEYNNAPPENPRIYLAASTRYVEITQDDQQHTVEIPYDINLLAQGKGPIPQISLTSTPPLSEREIVSLLTLGLTTSAQDERHNSEIQAANTSSAIGANLIKRVGGQSIKENLGVEFKVSTQPTPDTAASPKVSLSKQLTPNFGVTGSSTVEANPANSAKVEYKMNKNISVVGSWDGREYTQEQINPVTNVFGLDLEYKMQFK